MLTYLAKENYSSINTSMISSFVNVICHFLSNYSISSVIRPTSFNNAYYDLWPINLIIFLYPMNTYFGSTSSETPIIFGIMKASPKIWFYPINSPYSTWGILSPHRSLIFVDLKWRIYAYGMKVLWVSWIGFNYFWMDSSSGCNKWLIRNGIKKVYILMMWDHHKNFSKNL